MCPSALSIQFANQTLAVGVPLSLPINADDFLIDEAQGINLKTLQSVKQIQLEVIGATGNSYSLVQDSANGDIWLLSGTPIKAGLDLLKINVLNSYEEWAASYMYILVDPLRESSIISCHASLISTVRYMIVWVVHSRVLSFAYFGCCEVACLWRSMCSMLSL